MTPWASRALWCGLVIGAWGIAADARAASREIARQLDQSRAQVEDLKVRADSVDAAIEPGHGFLNPAEARLRFKDHLYEYMVGDYAPAAEGFHLLVTLGVLADPGLHRDAEWYLAESLFALGNFDTAEMRYQVIIDDAQHPFHDDAVRRLLELYAESGRTDDFRAAYEKYIVRGAIKPSDLVRYSVGRSFFLQHDYLKAKSHLLEIVAGSPQFARARYLLGAIAVDEQDLDQAMIYFGEILPISRDDVPTRDVYDLALLALGRIEYERGNFGEAGRYYDQISGDSKYLADKLYELVWTYIKQKEWEQARRGAEIFLLAFPEHAYTAQLRVLEGHLYFKQEGFEKALGSYERVVADYDPLREEAIRLQGSPDVDPNALLEAVDTVRRGDVLSDPGTLPVFAYAVVGRQPEVQRAVQLHREVVRQDADVQVSETILGELDQVLSSDSASIGSFDDARAQGGLLRRGALQARFDLLSLENEWLSEELTARDRAELGGLHKRLETTSEKLLSDATSTAAAPEIDALAREYAAIRSRLGADAAPVGGELDRLHQVCVAAEAKLAESLGRVDGLEQAELARIRDVVAKEVEKVGAERTDLETLRARNEATGAAVAKLGLRLLEEHFADSVLQADMGIVDVYWARKVQTSDRREAMADRKKDLLDDLKRRFGVIRQKLPAPEAAPPAPTAPPKEGP